MLHAVNGTLDQAEAEWDRRAALGVVLAAHGYPDSPRKGDVIDGLDRVTLRRASGLQGVPCRNRDRGRQRRRSGGRVLCVTALGDSVRQAQRSAYAAIARSGSPGMQYRTDIGHRALAARKG